MSSHIHVTAQTLVVRLFAVAFSVLAAPHSLWAEAPQNAVPVLNGIDALESKDLVPAGLIHIPFSSNFYSPYAFVVDKRARALSVWHRTSAGLKQIASFPADLGKSAGEKRSVGDHKTPEGIYFLLERLEGGSIDFNLYGKRAFTTDYPNFFDRIEGKTGNGIWLHAVPDKVPLTRGSRGCVVVRNDVIVDLTQYIKLGRTPILIQDQADLVSLSQINKTSTEFAQWLEKWRGAWETKNLEAYIDHYSGDFRSNNMNREQWRRYKGRLNQAYKSISLRLSKPSVFVDRNRAVVRFLQEYSSNLHGDVGEKVLYLKKEGDSYRIVGETWAEESSHLAREEIEANKAITTLGCSDGKVASGNSSECLRTSAIHE